MVRSVLKGLKRRGGGAICRHSETIKKVKIDNTFTGMKFKRSTVRSCNI